MPNELYTLYTVSRIDKKDNLSDVIHGSKDGENTVCGKILDHNWYIRNNTFDGIINCKKCIKILKEEM